MADIDKSLPNVARPEDEVVEDINIEEVEELKGPVEITDEEDGGATIDFDPSAVNIPHSDQQYKEAQKYYQDKEFLKIGEKLEDINIPEGFNKRIVNGKEYNPPKTFLQWDEDELNIPNKWKQLINVPGIKGTQDSFATGGLAGLMKKYYD